MSVDYVLTGGLRLLHCPIMDLKEKIKTLGTSRCARETGIPEIRLRRWLVGKSSVDCDLLHEWVQSQVDYILHEGTLNAICNVYSVSWVAKVCCVHREIVYRWMDKGTIPEDLCEVLWNEALNRLS